MLTIFDGLRDITLASVAVRLLLAVFCGGLVGAEREYKRRSAGFRTHILICLGAAMTTMTSEFLFLNLHYYLDMARLGAGVVAGIGFIGAGTIIVTGRQRVKGLTTAAGMWVVAVVGLAIGAGFYEGGLIAAGLVLLAELLFSKWEYRLLAAAPEINVYVEYADKASLEHLLKLCNERQVKVLDMEITRHTGSERHNASAIFMLRLNNKVCPAEELLTRFSQTEGVFLAEEM